MADVTIVWWRDIPAQVIVKAGRRSAKRPLPERFQAAIDRAAMRAGLRDTDGYLAAWRRAPAEAADLDGLGTGDDLDALADAVLARLDAAYTPERIRLLVAAGGCVPSDPADTSSPTGSAPT